MGSGNHPERESGTDRGAAIVPDARWEAYLRKAVNRYCDGDNLYRAQSAFRGMTHEQMQEQHGHSGYTRQQILDGYREAFNENTQAATYLEALIKQSRRAA